MKADEKGVVTNTTTNRILELEKQDSEAERNLLIEQTKTVTIIPREEIEKYIKVALKFEPKLLLNTLIREIKIYNERIEIYYNYSNTKGVCKNICHVINDWLITKRNNTIIISC